MLKKLRTLAVFATLISTGLAQDKAPVFSNPSIDLGIVVKDIEKSAKFYTEAMGMTEVKGFTAPAEKATEFGLTDNQEVKVRRFVLDPNAKGPKTSFKLMSFPNAPGKDQDQKFIHSTIGVSYLTLFVSDLDKSIEKLKAAKVKFLGKTPASLGGKNHILVFRDPDGNFIEFIGPMK